MPTDDQLKPSQRAIPLAMVDPPALTLTVAKSSLRPLPSESCATSETTLVVDGDAGKIAFSGDSDTQPEGVQRRITCAASGAFRCEAMKLGIPSPSASITTASPNRWFTACPTHDAPFHSSMP